MDMAYLSGRLNHCHCAKIISVLLPHQYYIDPSHTSITITPAPVLLLHLPQCYYYPTSPHQYHNYTYPSHTSITITPTPSHTSVTITPTPSHTSVTITPTPHTSVLLLHLPIPHLSSNTITPTPYTSVLILHLPVTITPTPSHTSITPVPFPLIEEKPDKLCLIQYEISIFNLSMAPPPPPPPSRKKEESNLEV